MSEQKKFPLPFEVVDNGHGSFAIKSSDGDFAVCCGLELDGGVANEDTAAFIVRACNSHEAMLEACNQSEVMAINIADQLDKWADESIRGGLSTHQVSPMRELANRIRACRYRRDAIALAEGGAKWAN